MDRLGRWMQGYIRAWTSNEPEDIAALFSDDARYRTEPYAEWRQGRDAIVAGWIEAKDEPGTWKFRWEPLAGARDLHFVRGWTDYLDGEPRSYSNLWVIRLGGDGRCSEFTEWWMKVPGPPGP